MSDPLAAFKAFCGNPDCPCVVNRAEPCDDWADPGEDAPAEPFHTRCARCGHARWKHTAPAVLLAAHDDATKEESGIER